MWGLRHISTLQIISNQVRAFLSFEVEADVGQV